MSQYLPSMILSGLQSIQIIHSCIFLLLVSLIPINLLSAEFNCNSPLTEVHASSHRVHEGNHYNDFDKEKIRNVFHNRLNVTGCANFQSLNRSEPPNRVEAVIMDFSHSAFKQVRVSLNSNDYKGHITLILAHKAESYPERFQSNGKLVPISGTPMSASEYQSTPITYVINLQRMKPYRSNKKNLKHRIFVREGDTVRLEPSSAYQLVTIETYHSKIFQELALHYKTGQTLQKAPKFFNKLLESKEHKLDLPNFHNSLDKLMINRIGWDNQTDNFIRKMSHITIVHINFTSENWINRNGPLIENMKQFEKSNNCFPLRGENVFQQDVEMMSEVVDREGLVCHVVLIPTGTQNFSLPRVVYWIYYPVTEPLNILPSLDSLFQINGRDERPLVIIQAVHEKVSVTIDFQHRILNFDVITTVPVNMTGLPEGESVEVNMDYQPSLMEGRQLANYVSQKYDMTNQAILLFNDRIKPKSSSRSRWSLLTFTRDAYDLSEVVDSIETLCDYQNYILQISYKKKMLEKIEPRLNEQFNLPNIKLVVTMKDCSDHIDSGRNLTKWRVPFEIKGSCLSKIPVGDGVVEASAMVDISLYNMVSGNRLLISSVSTKKSCTFNIATEPNIKFMENNVFLTEKSNPTYIWNDSIYVMIESKKNFLVSDCYFDDSDPDTKLMSSRFYILESGCHSEKLYKNSEPRSTLTYFSPDADKRRIKFKVKILDHRYYMRKGRLQCLYKYCGKDCWPQSKLCGFRPAFTKLVNSSQTMNLQLTDSKLCQKSLTKNVNASGIPFHWVAFITITAFLMGLCVSFIICCMKGTMKLTSWTTTSSNSNHCAPGNSLSPRYGLAMTSDSNGGGRFTNNSTIDGSDRVNNPSVNVSLLSPATSSNTSASKFSNVLKLNTCRCLECSSGSTPCSQKPLCHVV